MKEFEEHIREWGEAESPSGYFYHVIQLNNGQHAFLRRVEGVEDTIIGFGEHLFTSAIEALEGAIRDAKVQEEDSNNQEEE